MFFFRLETEELVVLGGKALDNFNAFPERTSLFMSCCWQMVVRLFPLKWPYGPTDGFLDVDFLMSLSDFFTRTEHVHIY